MTESKNDYLAWFNAGPMGTTWRADTIEEAVATCAICVVDDFPGIVGREITLGVFDVTDHDEYLLSGGGEVLACKDGPVDKEREVPFLFLVDVDTPTLRKNGKASGDNYRGKVRQAAFDAVKKAKQLAESK